MAELMTLEEAADYLRVTKKTVYRLVRQRKIPAAKIGQQWRFNKSLIDEWMYQSSFGTKANIIVIDDEETVRLLIKESLEELGHRVVVTGTGSEGIKLVKQQNFDLVFLDLKMPGIDGAEIFHQIRTIRPRLPVTIITGYPGSDLMARALALGPFGVMNKPFSEQDLVGTVNNFLRITAKTPH